MSSETKATVSRAAADIKPTFDRFVLNSKNYVQQYNLVYMARLAEMRAILKKVAVTKWGSDTTILNKIIDIESPDYQDHHQQQSTKEYILIGTIYKDMSLRGSVLDEFKEKNGITGTVQSLYHIASEKDTLALEDESGRVALVEPATGQADLRLSSTLVTGVVLAVKGYLNELGSFQITDSAFAHTLRTSNNTPSPPVESAPMPTGNSKYLLLISGLDVGNVPDTSDSSGNAGSTNTAATTAAKSSVLSAQLMMDYVTGRLTENATDLDIASKIVRVIIAGNSMSSVEAVPAKERHYHSKIVQTLASASPSKQFDVLLGQLLCDCPADIMPGDKDPTNLSMPQQPLHPCLFPHSCRFSTFSRVTNPYTATIGGTLSIMGHSGQPVTDIIRQRMDTKRPPLLPPPSSEDDEGNALMDVETTGSSSSATTSTSKEKEAAVNATSTSLDILQETLAWGHLCPTAPDTLPCYPFDNKDPFIINDEDVPDVLFAGNQTAFGSRLVTVTAPTAPTSTSTSATVSSADTAGAKQVRLITIPKFAETGMGVLVDISTNDLVTTSIQFH